MEKQQVRIIYYTFDQMPKIFHQFAEENKKVEIYDFYASSNPDELEEVLSPDYFGIILFSIRSNSELVEMTVLLKKYAKQLKLGRLKFAGFNLSKHPKALQVLQKLGIRDLFNTDIVLKTLDYKIKFWCKAIMLLQEKEILQQNAKANAEGRGSGKKNGPQILYKDPINFSSDCWIVNTKAPPMHRMGNWIFELLGPSPYAGRWVKDESGEKGEENILLWQWVPMHVEQFPFIEHEGNWYFEGITPQFLWKKNVWKFMGEAPKLYFMLSDTSLMTRIEMEGASLIIHNDSKYANAKRALIDKSCDPEMLQQTEMGDATKSEFADENGNITTTQEVETAGTEEIAGNLSGTIGEQENLDAFYRGKVAKSGKLFDDADAESDVDTHEGSVDNLNSSDIYKHKKKEKLLFDDSDIESDEGEDESPKGPPSSDQKNKSDNDLKLDFEKEMSNLPKKKKDGGVPKNAGPSKNNELNFDDETSGTDHSNNDETKGDVPFYAKKKKTDSGLKLDDTSPLDLTSGDDGEIPNDDKKGGKLNLDLDNSGVPKFKDKEGKIPDKNMTGNANGGPPLFKEEKQNAHEGKVDKLSTNLVSLQKKKSPLIDDESQEDENLDQTPSGTLDSLMKKGKKKHQEVDLESSPTEYAISYKGVAKKSRYGKPKISVDFEGKGGSATAKKPTKDNASGMLTNASNFEESDLGGHLSGEGKVDHINDKMVGDVNWSEDDLGGNLNLSKIDIKIFVAHFSKNTNAPSFLPLESKLSDIIDNTIVLEFKNTDFEEMQEVSVNIKCSYGGIKLDSKMQGKIISLYENDDNFVSAEIELSIYQRDDLVQIIKFYRERQKNIALFFKESKGF